MSFLTPECRNAPEKEIGLVHRSIPIVLWYNGIVARTPPGRTLGKGGENARGFLPEYSGFAGGLFRVFPSWHSRRQSGDRGEMKLRLEAVNVQEATDKLCRMLALIAAALFGLALAIIGSSHAS
jgi:hypothetical protein